MKVFRKQPKDHLDYEIDLSRWLETDDEVVSVDITAPDGLELTGHDVTPQKVRLWVKGGTDGESYKLSPLIHTLTRSKEVDLMIVVVEV